MKKLLLALLFFLAACAAPVPTPTAVPPTATTVPAAAAPTPAQGGAERVNGTVSALAGGKITLDNGRTLSTDEKTRVIRLMPITPADLKPGMYVAVTAKRQPDNTLLATQVNLFAEEQRGVGVGQRPLPGNALMTNATVDKVEGTHFTVTFPGGGANVELAPDAKLARFATATAGDIKSGENVSATVANGVATSVTIQ